jgi:hypothetical protein
VYFLSFIRGLYPMKWSIRKETVEISIGTQGTRKGCLVRLVLEALFKIKTVGSSGNVGNTPTSLCHPEIRFALRVVLWVMAPLL